jgi:hypothetical protein
MNDDRTGPKVGILNYPMTEFRDYPIAEEVIP